MSNDLAARTRHVRRQSGGSVSHRAPDLLSQLSAGMPGWMGQAACRDADPDMFFPVRGGQPDKAKAVCAICPVREECFEYAMDTQDTRHETVGIWGGTSALERQQLRARTRR